MQYSSRPSQQDAISSQHDEAVRQSTPIRFADGGVESLTFKRNKTEGVTGTILRQDETHGAVAQATVTIIEKQFCPSGFSRSHPCRIEGEQMQHHHAKIQVSKVEHDNE